LATALLTHPDCVLHEMGEGHPESPARLQAVMSAIREAGLEPRLALHQAPLATREQLARVHDPDYVDAVIAAAPSQG
jgi:acetoin utilization deacetylase AcuC-like enzyme